MTVQYHTLEQKLERLKEQIIHLQKIKKEIKSASDLKKDYAKEAFGMGRFRNILVHDYMTIDEKRVFENLQRLDLFKDFTKFVSEYLTKKAK